MLSCADTRHASSAPVQKQLKSKPPYQPAFTGQRGLGGGWRRPPVLPCQTCTRAGTWLATGISRNYLFSWCLYGAGGRNRTHTSLRTRNFELEAPAGRVGTSGYKEALIQGKSPIRCLPCTRMCRLMPPRLCQFCVNTALAPNSRRWAFAPSPCPSDAMAVRLVSPSGGLKRPARCESSSSSPTGRWTNRRSTRPRACPAFWRQVQRSSRCRTRDQFG